MDEPRKTYRPWDPTRNRQQRYSPEAVLPEDDLVYFLVDIVPQFDLSAFFAHYEQETRGAPPFDVPMMCTLLVYAYSVGVFSSRKIAMACERNLAFKAIVGKNPPDFRTISDFRKIHRESFRSLFIEVLRLAGELGMVRLGNLATDGSKFKANASRHKAMSYGYMSKEIKRLRAEIDKLLATAEQMDDEQDAALGSRRGDELPEELKRREGRLEKILAGKARLEADAAAHAAAKQQQRDEAEAKRQAEGRKRPGREPGPVSTVPEDKAQTNFTDPESKIMKGSNKGFDYCYNGQAVVDGAHQIIVAAEVTTDANDKQQAVPLAQAALANLEAAGIARPTEDDGQTPKKIVNTADTGYFSEDAVKDLDGMGINPHIATGRQKHHADETTMPEGQLATAVAAPSSETEKPTPKGVKEEMAEKLRTPEGKKLYAERKKIVEPVFGQMKHVRGFRQFLLRGLRRIAAEWQLVCLTHNLLKIWRYRTCLSSP